MFRLKIGLCAVLLSALGCSNNNEIKVKDDGFVRQASVEKAKSKRLHFKQVYNEFSYEGVEEVDTFIKVNPDSVPVQMRWSYNISNFKDEDGSIVYSTVFQDVYYKESHGEVYGIYDWNREFTVDVPEEVDLSKVISVELKSLEPSEGEEPVNIDFEDVMKAYQADESEVEGWSGKISSMRIFGNSDPAKSLDIVIHGDGFTESEMPLTNDKEELLNSKFGKMLQKSLIPLLQEEPLVSIKDNLNIWVVLAPSKESGTDVPSQNLEVATTYGATFGTNCVARSLTVKKASRVIEFSGEVPFDVPVVLVNSELRGGTGGAVAVFSNSEDIKDVMSHELAHTIVKFADEYHYLSDTEDLNADHATVNKCTEHHVDTMAVRNADRDIGGNRLSEDEEKLAPNLSLYSTPETVRWSEFMTPESPVVFFDYPKTRLQEEQGMMQNTLSGVYKTQKTGRKELLFLMGGQYGVRGNNAVSQMLLGLKINGHEYSTSELLVRQDPGSGFIFFAVADEDVAAEAELKGESHVEFYMQAGRSLGNWSADSQLITMPHVVFNPSDVGIFQGANPSLSKVFRSTYSGVMMNSAKAYNPVLVNEFVKYVQPYFN